MREAMIARGPDGAGIWLSDDGRVGLAHRRLAIIDLSEAGAQPMATADKSIHIVFNGEIYNYRELRCDLEAKGYSFHSRSDTEVLLYLYQEHGPDLVHYLRGMYAFAIWDQRKRGMLLVRDPFGIKPLYYADDGATLQIASQVKALLKGDGIDTSPEPAGHVGFFLWGHIPEPYTLYKGIRALPAGSMLWMDASGRRELKQFFNLAAELAGAQATALTISREEMRDRLRVALLDSVGYHLVADVPAGVFLSAGLDSTTIAALAKEAGHGPLHTVTLGFKQYQGSEDDETELAELVARHYGTIHQTRWVTKEDFQRGYPHLLDAMDQPTIDGVNSYFVSQTAAMAGLKVVLSGMGGDELFGSYASFQQIPRMVNLFHPFCAFPAVGRSFRYISAPVLKHFTSPKYAGLLEYGGSYGGAYLLRKGLFMPWELPALLDGEMVREGWNELQTLMRLEETINGVGNAHAKVTALETAWYMRNQLLRDIDWASMAHSLEIRTPFVDIELFRVVAALLNSSSVPAKADMAKSPKKSLPAQILSRRKTGFSIPVREWISGGVALQGVGRGLRGWGQGLYANWQVQ